MAIPPRPDSALRIISVHQVDPTRNATHIVDQTRHVETGRESVAGIQTEPDVLVPRRGTDGLPRTRQPLQEPRHRIVPTGGVFDK